MTVGPLSRYSYTPNFFTAPYSNNADDQDYLGVPSNPTLTAKSTTSSTLPRASTRTMYVSRTKSIHQSRVG
jgi:hypothetical protein